LQLILRKIRQTERILTNCTLLMFENV
jgi:hypothetical protein